MNLNENIKSRRLELGLTLEQVGQRVGVSRQTIQRYESGVISNIPYDMIVKLSEALSASPSELMGWSTAETHGVVIKNGKIITYDDLPPEGQKELESYAEYIRQKYGKGGDKDGR